MTFGDMVRGLCNNVSLVSSSVQSDRRQEEGMLSLNFFHCHQVVGLGPTTLWRFKSKPYSLRHRVHNRFYITLRS